MENYHSYIGNKMSTQAIFEAFAGLAVVGEPDSSKYPLVYVTIHFIGTPDEAEAYREALPHTTRTCIAYGKPLRKGQGVIWNSAITLEQLVGRWDTSVTADGGMSNEVMILKSDGTGMFAKANFGPYFGTEINWFVEEDVLYINDANSNICSDEIDYKPVELVWCMSGEDQPFTGVNGAYERRYYRIIEESNTLTDWEKYAETEYDRMVAHGALER